MNPEQIMNAAIILSEEIDEEHGDIYSKNAFLDEYLPDEIQALKLDDQWDAYEAAIEKFMEDDAIALAYAKYLLNDMLEWYSAQAHEDKIKALLALL